MKQNFILRYLGIILIFATFITTLHQHNDLQEHTDCQICTIQNTLDVIDTPLDVIYVSSLSLPSYPIFTDLNKSPYNNKLSTYNSRAPPLFS